MKKPSEKSAEQTEAITFPTWRHAIEVMRADGMTYGSVYTSARLGDLLREAPGTQAFQFAVIELKQHIEAEDGLYLGQIENGTSWKILEADQHEDQAQVFDRKVRRFAVRSVALRSATLMNPKAALSEQTRGQMEKNLEIAATRLVLISRQRSIVNALEKTDSGKKLLTR